MSSDDTDRGLRAAKPPVGLGAAPLVAQLLALLLVALGALGIHDVLARTRLVAQEPVLEGLLAAAGPVSASSPAVLAVAVVAVLLGLVLVLAALRRRPRSMVELHAATGVRIRRRDLLKVLRHDLEGVDGVSAVEVEAGRRTVRVRAAVLVREERVEQVRQDLTHRAESALSALERSPRIKVTTKESTR